MLEAKAVAVAEVAVVESIEEFEARDPVEVLGTFGTATARTSSSKRNRGIRMTME